MKGFPGYIRGGFWMLVSCFCYAGAASVARKIGGAYSPYELTLIRALVAVSMMAPLYLREGGSLLFWPKRMFMHFLTGVFTFFGIVFWFKATAFMPIADFFALQFVTPLLTIALAIMFLGERSDLKCWVATLVGFGGVLIILRPGIISVSFASIAALMSAVFYASDNTAIKSLSRSASPTMIVYFAHLLLIPISLPFAILEWRTPEFGDLGNILLVSLLLTTAYLTITKAISLTVARIVQPVNFMRMPIAAVFGWILFSEFPDVWTWVGAIIIFFAATYAVSQGTDIPKSSDKHEALSS